MKARITAWILPIIITVLAVADGLLHLWLIPLIFGGKFWGTPTFGPPPGAAAAPVGAAGGGAPPSALPFISLPNNELFILNCIGFVLLAALLWLTLWRMSRGVWAVDGALIGISAASILGWVRAGEPNPQMLGYWSKGLEVALIVTLVVHLGTLLARRGLALGSARRDRHANEIGAQGINPAQRSVSTVTK